MKYNISTGFFNNLLPVGCRFCIAGLKIVVFVTGICLDRCWYCPISREKKGKQVFYVNEEKVSNLDDVIIEAYRVNALGAGITGGDPLYSFERTYNVVKALKHEFGDKFHIHLYTSGTLVDENTLDILHSAGVDEIRFHIYSMELFSKVEYALELGFDVGIEVPFIPTKEHLVFLKKLVKKAEESGVKFININEFEVSETNIDKVILHNLTPKGHSVAELGNALIEFLRWCSKHVKNLSIHYCTLWFKDNVQFKRRMYYKALNTLGPHEILLKAGTILLIHLIGSRKQEFSGLSIVTYNNNLYLIPSEVTKLLGKNVKAFVEEYYVFSPKPLNKRLVKY